MRCKADPSDDSRVHDELHWTALRSYQPDRADYSGQNRLGLKIRASGQLSGRLDRLSAIVQQKAPVHAGGAWTRSDLPSSNPAAIFRWFARGIYAGGRLVVGSGLPPARIDDDILGCWFDWCQARGLECNLPDAGSLTNHQVLTMVAQCGRASTSWQTGKLGVVWDEENRPATGLVSPGNIVAGSFRVEYAPGKVTDEIAVRYIEPGLDWQYNTVRRTRPGLAGPAASTATVTARGVTSRAQAATECNLQAARQHYHHRRLFWEMGREGRSYPKGTVVRITHGLIGGGAAGGPTRELELTAPIDAGGSPVDVLWRFSRTGWRTYCAGSSTERTWWPWPPRR